jgi:CSLREA domain-containing protein
MRGRFGGSARRLRGVVLVAVLAGGLLAVPNALASAYFVSTPAELQTAIDDADLSPGSDTIYLAPTVFPLGNPNGLDGVDINSDGITLIGAGAGSTILDGEGTAGNVVSAGGENITIEGVTVRNGTYDGIDDSGSLVLRDSVVEDNARAGIETTNTSLAIFGSTITGNGTSGNTFENTAGVYVESPFLAVNTTISGNRGYGVSVDYAGQPPAASLTNVTIEGNELTGLGTSDIIDVTNTIIANNGGGDCDLSFASPTSLGHNLVSDGSCGFAASGDLSNTSPQLGPLQDNGGPTPTMALAPTSPAVDGGDDAADPPTDQRGVRRPHGLRGDIGAFELANGPAVTVTQPAPGSVLRGTVTVAATVFDDVAPITHVDFSYLGRQTPGGPLVETTIGTDNTPPYSIAFDTTQFPNTLMLDATIYAEAFDTAANHQKAGNGITLYNPAPGRIVFESDRDGNSDIWSMDPDGGNPKNLTNTASGLNTRPSVSPDGNLIAFERGTPKQVWLMNADGSNQHPLTADSGQGANGAPAFSPDGSKIAYETDRDGPWQLYVMDTDGTNQTRVTRDPAVNDANDVSPSWSPDGTKLAFDSDATGDRDIWTINLDGTVAPENLTDFPSDDTDPDWSPDGQTIVFSSDKDGPMSVWTMDANGGSPQNVSSATIYDADPTWSPDGKQIAFVRDDTGAEAFNIWTAKPDGTAQLKLTSAEATQRNSFPDWSPETLSATVTSDDPTTLAGGINGFTITINNPTPSNATLSSISAKRPPGLYYIRNSAKLGGTFVNPFGTQPAMTGTGGTLTWNGSFTVPAYGTFAAHFDVGVTQVPGVYTTTATASTVGGTTVTSGDASITSVSALANSLVIVPEADTYVDAANPTTNFGTQPSFDTFGGDGFARPGPQYGLLRFDLSSLPAGAVVTSARLRLVGNDGFAYNGDAFHHALFIPDDSWTETGVTFATRPADSAPAVLGTNRELGSDIVFYGGVGGLGNQMHLFQGPQETTSFMRQRVAAEAASDDKLSIELFNGCCGPNGTAYWATYYSREAANPEWAPELIVTFAPDTPQTGSTFTVNTNGDYDGTCGHLDCTLREAINAANAHPATDTIDFNIPGGAPQTIRPLTPLPTITDPAVIDGTTQPGFVSCAAGPVIQLDGTSVGGPVRDGFSVSAGSTTIRGFVINRFSFPGRAVYITGSGGNTVGCNYIGTNLAGTAASSNWVGVSVNSPNNAIGGAGAGARNVISGNQEIGIRLQANDNVVQGNYIGTNAAGNAGLGTALGPNATGIFVNGTSGHTIGGTTPALRNVISGNGGNGIAINGTGVVVQGNYIGVNAAGDAAVRNVSDGIYLGDSTVNNVVGGTATGAGNVISGNGGFGILSNGAGSSSFGNDIQGNFIGPNANGTAPLGNASGGVGMVQASFGSRHQRVGGTAGNAGNLISGNLGPGVAISGSNSIANSIEGNSISANAGLGIDLGNDGVTPNDAGDGDSGPNGLQNFPVITSAVENGATTQIDARLDVTSGTYRIEYFTTPSCDSSGNGEGSTFLGSADIVFSVPNQLFSIGYGASLPAGTVLTMTATAPDGSTSEFSDCVDVLDTTPPGGTIDFTASAANVEAGAAQVQLNSVPPSVFLNSTAVGSIPVGSIPVGSIPVGSIPVGSIPVGSIGLAANQRLLSSVALSTIPLLPPHSWNDVLATTPFAGLPLQNVTLADVLANNTVATRLNSVPVGSIDLSRSPLGSITVAALGLGSTPVGSIPVPPANGEPATDSTLTRWCTWFRGPPINCTDPNSLNLPSQQTTLVSAALQGAPVGSIPVGSIPVGSIPVGSIPVGSIPLGSIPVGSITVQRVNIQYSPVGSIPLGSIPLGSISVGSIPVGSIPVGSINLANSPVGSIPVGSIPVGSIHTVFNCTTACPTTGPLRNYVAQLQPSLTLEQLLRNTAAGTFDNITFADVIAWTNPQTLHDYTITDLINSLPPNSGITYADLLALLLDPASLGWETLDLQTTRVQNFSTGGSTLGYHAAFSLTPSAGSPGGAARGARLRITLPAGFVYVPGTSDLKKNGISVAPPGDPTVLSDGTLQWSVTVNVGSAYRLDFTTRPGLTLGPAAATARIIPIGGVGVNAATPAIVTVGDTFETNDSPATARPVAANTFYLSYLTSKTDVDYYTLPVPPAGSHVTFHLSHLPADYDLVVYGPAGASQIRPPSATTPPIDGQPLADDGFGTTHATDPLAPQTLNDVVLASGLPPYGVSTMRGTQDDDLTVVSNGETGVYTIQVSSFNGAASNDPYMLRVNTAPPPIAPVCAPRAFGGGTGTQASSLVTTATGQVASAVNTLFVVDDQQLERIYANGASVVNKLNSNTTLAGFSNAGFPAAVVHVDANAGVRGAFDSWNACPTDPEKANTTVRAIAGVLDTVRQTYTNAEYVVLVGGDDALPFARIDDLTTLSNEAGYGESFAQSTALGSSLSLAKLLTDDPYTTTEPVPFLNRQLFVPDLVGGRLVETPTNINAQLDAFLAGGTPGHLHPTTALTTGYDFLSDGATAVSNALGLVASGANANKADIDNSWTKATLVTDLLSGAGGAPRGIVSVNAHADHNHFKPAVGTDLLSADEVRAATQTFGGRLVFSMGCHAGLSVFDAFVANNNLDWAQEFADKGAAAYVANTGYGYGDSTAVAYSEDLNGRFAEGAVGGATTNATGASLTLGEALTAAKQSYKGDLGIVGAYDEKAMAELTLYGLPMYRIGGSGIAPPPTAPTSGLATKQALLSPLTAGPTTLSAPASSFLIDPITGLHIESFAADRTFGSAVSVPPRGSYFTGSDGVIIEHLRPIEPKAIVPVTIEQAHGALLTQLSSSDVNPFDPVYARPTVDSAVNEPEVGFDDVAFPSKLQAVTTFKRLRQTKQQVVLAQGQFFSPSDGASGGTQRLFTHEAGHVLSSTSNDFAPPVFTILDAQKTSGEVAFAIDVSDRAGAVKRVLVAYKDGSGAAWHFLDLSQAGTGSTRWTGSGPIVGSQLQYFVQAVDAAGNVGVSTNKGLYYEASAAPPPAGNVVVATTDAAPASGWFDGSADVEVTVNGHPPATGTTTVSVDGGPQRPYTGAVHVTGDGPHTVVAQSLTGSDTTSFLIDSGGPTITITTPAPGSVFAQNQPVGPPVFACTDAGIGVQSCVMTGDPFNTATNGTRTFTVTGTDKLGKTSTLSRTWTVGVRRIVFSSQRTADGDIYSLVPTTSSTLPVPSLLGMMSPKVEEQPALSPDGSKIAFASKRADKDGSALDIYVMNADGLTAPLRLTTASGDDTAPAWSPDGTKIAFQSKRDGAPEIWVMNATDGSEQTRLTNSAKQDIEPTWSPDGSKIAFMSDRMGGPNIWVMSSTGGPATQLTFTKAPEGDPAWSPNGSLIAYGSKKFDKDGSGFDVLTMKPDGTFVQRLTTAKGDDFEPVWSRNGGQMAFTSNRDGNPEIYVMNANGTSQTRQTNKSGFDRQPDW